MGNEDKSLKTGFQVLTVISTLLIFGGAIWLAKEQMGGRIREQVLARYTQELYAISLVHQVTMAESGEILFLEDVADQLSVYGAVAELSGALGVRLYMPDGGFLISSPENISDGALSADQLHSAGLFAPSGGLNKATPAGKLFWEPLLEGVSAEEPLAVREVVLPVHVADEDDLLGVAQFLFDGADAIADIAELDGDLFRQSLFIYRGRRYDRAPPVNLVHADQPDSSVAGQTHIRAQAGQPGVGALRSDQRSGRGGVAPDSRAAKPARRIAGIPRRRAGW